MKFIHEDVEFDDLLHIIASERGLSVALAEKDYWVTHTLWALHNLGLEIWFKGGTSLSKGFGTILRFSEDLDLKIDAPPGLGFPTVSNWKGEGTKPVRERRDYFQHLAEFIRVPGATVFLGDVGKSWRSVEVLVSYPGRYLSQLGVLRPSVLLEIGNARVTPFIVRSLSSFVHDKIGDGLAEYIDNRPHSVRCVHPTVTLIEKLDALHSRFPKTIEPAAFVRHFEDAAHIVKAHASLPPLGDFPDVRGLAQGMLSEKQIRCLPDSRDPAFSPDRGERWREIRYAHSAINSMFWGPRLEIESACAMIRAWITRNLET